MPVQEVPALTGQVPLLSGRVNLGDQAAVLRALAVATQGLGGSGVTVSTQLPRILADAAHQRHAMSTIVAVGGVQLVVLSIWVLAGQAARTGDARRDEVRVARLRGFPVSSLLWAAGGEPSLLCAAGIPLGVVGAWAVVTAARDHLLSSRATVTIDGWEVVAFALTVAAIAATVGLGVWRSLRSSRLSRRSGGPDSRWLSLTGDAVLLVLSVVAVVDLTISGALAGRSDPIAAIAPALIGLGVAVVAVHLLLAACRFAIKRTDYSAWTASFLAVRQVARRQGTLRQARALVIASCLACFGVAAWSVARSNRHTVAGFTVGASTVATVVPKSASLQSAVDIVDPSGRFAMAAQTITTASSNVLAVDSSRLARTVVWPAGLSTSSARAASRSLVVGSAPEVVLPSGSVRVSAIATGPEPVTLGQIHLGLWVFNPAAGTSIIDLGPLRAGSAVYSASEAAACPAGCRLGGLSLMPAAGVQPSGSARVEVTVTGLASASPGAARSVAVDLSGRAWRSSGVGVEVTASSGGLSMRASMDAIAGYEGAVGAVTPPMATPIDHPALIPAVVTSEVESINGGPSSSSGVPVLGLDGNTVDVDPVVTVPAIPGMGPDAVMVDRDTLGRLQISPTLSTIKDQVWLGPAAPADVLARLEQAGLHVEGVQRASTLDSQYEHTGSALADDFFLLATLAALLVAAVSTLAVVGSSFRPRATELAALEVAGVPRRVIARSLGIESAILGTTAVFGAAAGAATSALALRSLPELASSAPIPLLYSVPPGPILLLGGVSLLIVLGAAAIASTLLLHEISPALLRQIPDDIPA